ncbi:MAG: hypothetical protein ACLQK4_04480 [Acidimicrobiales bacterium]|jgi:hypothetical protein
MSLTGQDLNELCSENYLDGLAGASVSELRSLRDACQRAEAVLSYLRRVIQGNIDLVVAESKVRQDGGHSDLGRLVDELPSILASSGPLAEDTDHVSVRSIKAVTQILDLQHDLALEELLSQVLAEEQTNSALPGGLLPGANLCTFADEDLRASLARLREQEVILSKKRRILHGHIDAIQAAIVERYKSGAADPDTLLS